MKCLQQADKKCRKLRMGQVAWSPELAAAMLQVKIWKLICRRHTGAKVNDRYLNRQLKQANLSPGVLSVSFPEAKFHLHQAFRAYLQLKKTASSQRTAWLEELATAIAHYQGEGTTAKTALKQLQLREKQRAEARTIKRANGKLRANSGLPMVIAPDPATRGQTRKECYTKQDIEEACIEENKRRFWQASDTPFMKPPIFDKVGPLGLGPGADEILETGTLTLDPGDEPLDDDTVQYIKQLQCPDHVTDLPLSEAQITTTKNAQSWKAAKEATSSGDPLLHYGHCKATALHPHLGEFETFMRNIPFITGYSPQRWKRAVNVELLKKPGNFNVERLRTILLMEAQWNNNNKIIGRELLWHAERQDLIAPEQYGSRKNRSANTQALNKKLVQDLFRQQRLTGAIGSNDAKSCYDRIVHSVAMLSMRRVDYPVEPLISMFSTLHELKQYI